MKTFAIIKIAGKGTRVNSSVPKQYIEVNGRPIFIFTLIPFNESDHVDVICVVCDAEHMNFVRKKCAEFGIEKAKYFCVGGKNGNASTFNGYNAIRCDLQDNDIIISHDGVRALVTEEIIADSVNVAKNYKAAIAAYSTTGNILFKDSEYKYIKREKILIAQTPISLIKLNFDRCASFFKTKDVNSQDAYAGLDDIAFALNIPMYKSKGSSLNFKITTDNDLIMFRALVEKKVILNKQEQAEIDYYLERYDCFKALNNKTVLITGYKGLVGAGITKWLLRYKEKTSIHLNLYLSSRNPDVLPDWLESKDDVKFTKFLTEADMENDYDIIIHLAAPTDKKYFVVNPIDSIDSIYEGTKYYLNLARKQASCQFLYVSSVEVYGCPCGDLTLDESYVGKFSSFDVRSGYPLGKKAAEFLCFSYWIQYGVRTYVIRPSSIQGLFQRYDETRIFNEILRCMIEGKDFVMKSDGRTKKNLIYSLDAISAIFSVLQNGKPGQAYNVTNPSIYLSMNDYVETVFKSFNANLKIVHKTEKDQKEGFLPHLEYNLCTKKIERLGWKPFADLYHIYSIDMERFAVKKI